MEGRPILCRRARRTDVDAVFSLFDGDGGMDRQLDRAGLHRFRRLVADLGADCYVAVVDETVVGLVHVTYARHLLDRQRATVELLRVTADARLGDVGAALARLVAERARRRGCRFIDWREPARDAATQAFATHLGARPVGEHLQVEIPGPGE